MQKKYEKRAKQTIEALRQKDLLKNNGWSENMKDVDKSWETAVMEKLRQALDSDSCRTAEDMSIKYESWKALYIPGTKAFAARREASDSSEPRDWTTGKYLNRNKPRQTGTGTSGSFLGSDMYTAGSDYQGPSNTLPYPPARNDQLMWPAGGVPARRQSQSTEQPTFLSRPAITNTSQVEPVSSHQRPANNPAYPHSTNYQPQSPTGGVALVQTGNLSPSTPFLGQRVYTSGPQPSSGQQGSGVHHGSTGQRNNSKEDGK
ncbi:hypothetical protein QBC37DRAFT_405434 [Rhypophila decipiens]|uniref:Uncharacterized protein n=1 Tax=Rhypophila decipiens TaxID=261697 RepID=A0AAN6XZ02_9PEZI|nr:hypothetical protein QBC37DRAFT_405434 [Rhypophila decipiens]